MNQVDEGILKKMKIDSEIVVINQLTSKKKQFEVNLNNWNNKLKWLNVYEKGLSRSRNLALKHCSCDIGILADDDLIYVNDYEKIIKEQYEKYPDADIITFQVEGIGSEFKKYKKYVRKLNYLTSMKVASVEITFRTNSIKEKGIIFDEKFGSGAKYYMGEENVFLYDCLKSGLKIIYVPVKIADLNMGKSSWFDGYNQEYFINKGAAFTRLSTTLSYIFIYQFAVRKIGLYSKNLSIFQAVKYMMIGRKQYLTEIE
jgi:hypothetical protein